MDEHAPRWVAVDLASLVVFGVGGARRCLDTALRACDVANDVNDERALRRVGGALERILVAHITCDPFVEAIAGVRAFFEGLRRDRGTVIGVATFSTAVTSALLRRFGWDGADLVLAPSPSDGDPLWSSVVDVASARGLPLLRSIFLSDDRWELASAARHGCALPLAIGPRYRGVTTTGIGFVTTLREARTTITSFWSDGRPAMDSGVVPCPVLPPASDTDAAEQARVLRWNPGRRSIRV